MAMKQLLILAFAVACSHAADPNFRNLFYQTTRVVQNQVLADVQGRVPSWLDGDFVRQNCASYGDIDGPPQARISHMFDCISMVGRYQISNGAVKYSNVFYDTKETRIWSHFNYSIAKAGVSWNTLVADINIQAYVRDLRVKYNETLWSTPNVNFWNSKGTPILAVTESLASPTEIKVRPELQVAGLYYRKFKNTGFSRPMDKYSINPAHEQVDKDGTIWSATLDVEPYSRGKIDNLETAIIVYSLKGSNRTAVSRYVLGKYNLSNCGSLTQKDFNIMPGYTHYIETTENFILVPQNSYRYNYCQDFSNRKKIVPMFKRFFGWYPNVNSSILIFDRSNMSVVHHVSLPFPKFFTHSLNAYETASHIFLDTLAYDNVDLYFRTFNLTDAIGGYNWSTSFLRIAIDKNTWSYDFARSGPLTKKDPFGKVEFPNINYDRVHQKDYTFSYFNENPVSRGSRIAKLNVKTKEVVYWNPPLGFYPQEPIFVQQTGTTGEDEGVVLCSGPVSNPSGTSFLAILNATDLKQIAMVKNPNAALFALHNRFYASHGSSPAPATRSPPSSSPPTTNNSPKSSGTRIVPGILSLFCFVLFKMMV